MCNVSYYISLPYKGSWNVWVRQTTYIEPNHTNKKLRSKKRCISELKMRRLYLGPIYS